MAIRSATSVNEGLAARLWPVGAHRALRVAALILLGSALLALSAHVQVPFWPVKMSMQTFVVLMLAVAYGGPLAAATVLAYIAEGALGLPVFQSGEGLAYFAGPTTGYLAGFVVAALLVGTLAQRGTMRTRPRAIAALVAGDGVIFLFGVAWLSTLIGFEKALIAGLVVFLPAEALKIALAAALLPLLRRNA